MGLNEDMSKRIILSLIDNHKNQVIQHGNNLLRLLPFISINILFSPGNGTFDQVKTWPRFCSFQNSGANLTGNVTQVSLARTYCEKELDSTSSTTSYSTTYSTTSNPADYLLPSLVNLFLLKLTHLLIS